MMSFKCMVVGFSIHSLFAGRLHRCVVYPYTRYTKTNALASMRGSITPALLPLGHARQWVNINTGTHTHREESHTYCASPTTLTHSHTHACTYYICYTQIFLYWAYTCKPYNFVAHSTRQNVNSPMMNHSLSCKIHLIIVCVAMISVLVVTNVVFTTLL